jgi:Putative Na+/H+ antiporter
VPERLKYLAAGVLFVNISIGGTMTSFAAPPVLMVAATWQWDSAFMFSTFGWKAALAVLVNATVCTFVLRRHLSAPAPAAPATEAPAPMPKTVAAVHLALLAGVVTLAHHPVAFLALFLMFLGFTQAYARHQSPLILKEALLVAFFLAGLVVLGGLQSWWLQPIVSGLQPLALFAGALGLTAITDNAALTYLGAQISGISDASKYMLVAGAVAGGGLTVIANAPNPAGVALLRRGFADESIGAGGLLLGAAGPTVVAAAAFLLL